MTQSKREIPHFYVSVTVDMTAAMAYRESHGKKVSFNALLMRAVVAGLEAEPSLNVAFTDAGYVPHKSVNVGLAIETPKGVVIAVIEDVAECDDEELMGRMAAAVEAVRSGDMQAVKTGGACMTISNIGMVRTRPVHSHHSPRRSGHSGSQLHCPAAGRGRRRRGRPPDDDDNLIASTTGSPTAWRPRGFWPPRRPILNR